jgi:hypothetical protein
LDWVAFLLLSLNDEVQGHMALSKGSLAYRRLADFDALCVLLHHLIIAACYGTVRMPTRRLCRLCVGA